jgi:hypothetical protein
MNDEGPHEGATGGAPRAPNTLQGFPHRTDELFLQILGGFLLAYLVSHYEEFFGFLKVGSKTPQGDMPHDMVVWLAYVAYVVNVFRQIYGLGIVFTDRRYYEQVGQHLSSGLQFLGLMLSIIILSVPYILTMYIKESLKTTNGQDVEMIVYAYIISMLCYMTWI